VTRLGLLVTDLGPATAGPSALTMACSLAAAAEQAGFDSLWVDDHLGAGEAPPDPTKLVFEAYSLLGALATQTHAVRLGAFPRGVDPRLPSSLAKMVSGLDVISGGRGVVTLSSGPLRVPGAVDRLAEALQVCRSVLDDEHPGFAGAHYAVAGALNQPPPVQAGGVPLVVLVDSKDRSWVDALGVAANFADAVVVDGGPEAVSVAADAAADQGGGAQVIWVGTVPSSLAETISAVMAATSAGATGCVIAAPIVDGGRALAHLGPALLEVFRPVRAPDRA
jgi:alkanesulfonate monooxygenase SsuD/methylene tetrahydromethanopterin reductase-like flavin-dependent oxidoreductase (luciferase family)